jgi:hypothetical protein
VRNCRRTESPTPILNNETKEKRNMKEKMKYDFYRKNIKTGKEEKVSAKKIHEKLCFHAIDLMCGPEAKIIIKSKYEYWAEEAIKY